MLIVVGIVGVIVGMVLLAGRGAVQQSKISETRVLMTQLDTAIQAFADQALYRSAADLSPAPKQSAFVRYGSYPPDEIMAYDAASPSGKSNGPNFNLMPSGVGRFVKLAGTDPVDFVHDDAEEADSPEYVKFGDLKALVWALRALPETRVMYEAIPSRFRVTAALTEEFFDINDNQQYDALVDREVQYLVDAWDQPLQYFATHLQSEEEPTTHGAVADKLVGINKNLPVLLSYGPDGEAQTDTLEQQYLRAQPGGTLFPSPLNEDNIYLDPALPQKIRELPAS